jgi:DNA mismatch repair protein MutS
MTSAHTPLMQQYFGIKAQYPDTLVLLRMGDFYELFYEDARKAARLLNITLTSRGESAGQPVVMAGVPVHALDQYLARLVRAGESAVVAEQVGEPGAEKGPMRREVTRVVTPGTATDESLLDPRAQNLLAAAVLQDGRYGLAWMELSSGRFTVLETASQADFEAELHRLRPSELLLEDGPAPLVGGDFVCTRRPPWHFDSAAAARLLTAQFGTRDLRGFGCEGLAAAIAAAGALLQYAQETQKTLLPHLKGLRVEAPDEALILDPATRRNLEIDRTLSGDHDRCLLQVLDACVTAMGSRQLARWLLRPLRDRGELGARHDAIAALIGQAAIHPLRDALREVPDIERILSRVALRSARPRDLLGLRNGLAALPAVRQALATLSAQRLVGLHQELALDAAVLTALTSALSDTPPLLAKDGGVFRAGYDAALDELRALSENADGFLVEMERRERAATGIDTLKVGYNRVHGFYIEIGKTHAARVPNHYSRRQTLTHYERYITDELKRFEDQVLSARDRALARERELYEHLLDRLIETLQPLQDCARAVAELDVLANLAERAVSFELCRPEFVEGACLEIQGGRHPVVERTLERPFVPNDLSLDEGRRLLIITGPNMGGKSTYMRQTALIVLMAHAGCYVPARAARLGIIDRIFTRIGASDDLASGQSTFMVEMSETANILNNASAHSLVLMDEIGRGTSTYDGLSLARACAEYLAQALRCYALFATHYFEITRLADELPGVANVHLDAVEYGDKLVFLHDVRSGPANRSFGLQVAALAGVPSAVIARARDCLAQLEGLPPATELSPAQPPAQMALFDARNPEEEQALKLLRKLDPDTLSPREALEFLYRLKLPGKPPRRR